MLEHRVRRAGAVFILDLSGRVSSTDALASEADEGMTLRDILLKRLEEGAKQIVLNLKDVSYIDSAGIGVIFGLYTSLQRSGGRLLLLNPNARLRDVMKLTRLDTVIEVADNEADAVRAMAYPEAAGR